MPEESGEETQRPNLDGIESDAEALGLAELTYHPLLTEEEEKILSEKTKYFRELISLNESIEKKSKAPQTEEQKKEIEELKQQKQELEKDTSRKKTAETARNRLVECNQKLVISIAKEYLNRGIPLIDIVQEGNLGLITAAETYDYQNYGNRFSTYATWWIRKTIARAIENNSRTIRIPGYIQEEFPDIGEARKALQNELGRAPTDKEIVEHLNLPQKWIQKLNALPVYGDSLDKESSRDSNNHPAPRSELIEDENQSRPEKIVEKKQQLEQLEKILENGFLTPFQKRIFKMYYFKGMTINEIVEEMEEIENPDQAQRELSFIRRKITIELEGGINTKNPKKIHKEKEDKNPTKKEVELAMKKNTQLTEDEKMVLNYSFGINKYTKQKDDQEIGRILGKHSSQVTELRTKALRKLGLI